ncbi:MAG: hypothetical protein AMXMBFR59_23060 [Rhodanobacteraceae bacterium]
MNAVLRHLRIALLLATTLSVAGCVTAPSQRAGTITLRYAESDYRVYETDARAEGRYEVRHSRELTYLTRRIPLDTEKLAAIARLADRQNFFALPADLAQVPDAGTGDCDPDADGEGGCERLDRIVVTSDCGPDSHLRISDGRRTREVHWGCSSGTPAVVQPLLDAIRALFAEHPSVANAPAPRRWRRWARLSRSRQLPIPDGLVYSPSTTPVHAPGRRCSYVALRSICLIIPEMPPCSA